MILSTPGQQGLLNDWRAFDVHLARHSVTDTKLRSWLSAAMAPGVARAFPESRSGVPLLVVLVRKYRIVPALPSSFGTRPALSAAAALPAVLLAYHRAWDAPGWAWPRMRASVQIPAVRRHFLRCCCGSQLSAPFTRKVWRPACIEAREPPQPLPRARYASPGAAIEIDYFFASS